MSDDARIEYRGNEAVRYASHLKKVSVDGPRWEIDYEDTRTGEIWLWDYPDGSLQGGGEPRLRRLATVVELNQELLRSGCLWRLIDDICSQLRFANDKEEAEKLQAARAAASSRKENFGELSMVLTDIIDNHLLNPDLGQKLRNAREITHWVLRSTTSVT